MVRKESKGKRFVMVHTESNNITVQTIILDKETGVHYLFHQSGAGGGLTPLLDKDGKPVISGRTNLI